MAQDERCRQAHAAEVPLGESSPVRSEHGQGDPTPAAAQEIRGVHLSANPRLEPWQIIGESVPLTRSGPLSCPTAHYKLEAGADARYLQHELEAMLDYDVFVDSNDLVDLQRLFTEGVQQSETIILLGTRGVLTRPWCLLELYEARRNNIPVVTFAVAAHNFTPTSARAQLRDMLETRESLPEGAEGAR